MSRASSTAALRAVESPYADNPDADDFQADETEANGPTAGGIAATGLVATGLGAVETRADDRRIASDTAAARRAKRGLAPDEFFERQPAATHRLPNPEPLLINLTRCVIEILAGARELEQISRWVTDDVYRHLLKRVVLSARARQARGQRVARPSFVIGSTRICTPHDGVVEAVVIVSSRARTRAVAIRLEGLDDRWRATAINVL